MGLNVVQPRFAGWRAANGMGVAHRRRTIPTLGDSFIRFGSKQPRFIAPMVVENAPPFSVNDSKSLDFYKSLLETAKSFSQPTVTGRKVGVVAVGESGKAYLGTNIEIKGGAPANGIHAEGFAVMLAKSQGETGIKSMVLSLQPCGTCRQVLSETGNKDMPIHVISEKDQSITTRTLDKLFPFAYTYATSDMNLFKPPPFEKPAHRGRNLLVKNALEATTSTYHPNPRKDWAGMAVLLKNGELLKGSTTVISGPNPTITAVQEILIKMVSGRKPFSEIQKAVLIEPKDPDYSSYHQTQDILEKIAPHAQLKRVRV